MKHIVIPQKRRKSNGNRNGSFKIYRWITSIRTRAFKSIYVSSYSAIIYKNDHTNNLYNKDELMYRPEEE
ncbi:hypothetical protein, partial [Bacillus sp. 71mf]